MSPDAAPVFSVPVSYREVELDLADFLARFSRPEACLEACRACPRYGATWACPPFGFSLAERLSSYKRIRLMAITFQPTGNSGSDFNALRPVRSELNDYILRLEASTPGSMAFAFGGSCTLCTQCTRPLGQPCLHPEAMRHSLESFGIDLTAALPALLDITLHWTPGSPITLTSALLLK